MRTVERVDGGKDFERYVYSWAVHLNAPLVGYPQKKWAEEVNAASVETDYAYYIE